MASEDSGLSGLAQRYATALFDLADEAKALDTVAQDLRSIQAMLDESGELVRLIRSPTISRGDQGKALASILEQGGVSDLTRKFVAVVAGNRRAFALPGMIKAFLEELAARRGEIVAEVMSATALSPAQTERLTDEFKRVVGSKVSVQVSVDPSLLGGIIVKVGSRMIDDSLRTKLNRLQFAMKGVG